MSKLSGDGDEYYPLVCINVFEDPIRGRTEMDSTFNELCQAADSAEEKIEHLPLLEPYLLKTLEYVIAHPEKRKDILEKFFEILNSKEPFSLEIVAYCMRELQWPEILTECKRIRADPNYSQRRILGIRGVLDVYSGEWDGDIFYQRFKKCEAANE